jgi:WD40 repeat protein
VIANVRVFISYAHKDGSALASQLCGDLVKSGYVVWLDVARLGGGSDWSREIETEIDAADVVLALLSRGSFESYVCRGEQLRSLRRGKCVVPLLVHPGADRPIYLEARQYRDFSVKGRYHQSFEELIHDIEARSSATLASAYQETRYDTVPPLPFNFVSRKPELESLRQAVLSDRDQHHVALVALKGMGGIGKTVLAQALCYDEAVQAAFPDGIIWVKIGDKPTEAHLVNQMREAAKVLGKSAEGFDTLEGSSNLLRNLLKDKSALLILDDVWNAKHVSYFQLHSSKFCRLLLTTRDADIGKAIGAKSHSLNLLTTKLSLQLVAKYAGLSKNELPSEVDGIVKECAGLPLALAMIGAMLQGEPNSRWADALNSLKNADLDKIRIQFPDYPFPSLVAAIDASVTQLPEEIQRCYLDLAVFPDDTAIPDHALTVVWRREGSEARQIASQLVNKSLAVRDVSGRLGLHDLLAAYVRIRAGDLFALHNRLLDEYEKQCSMGWATGPDDEYFFEHLAFHLKEAERVTELTQLLSTFEWLQRKLEITDVNALIADYDCFSVEKGLRLVQSALRLSAHELSHDARQLPGQLIGRLFDNGTPSVQALVNQAAEWKIWPWLRPLAASLAIAGGPLIRVLEAHTDWVHALTVTPDSRHAVSGGYDEAVRVWDLETGRTELLQGHTGPIHAVAVTSDGRRAISASGDAMLRVWNLENCETACTVKGHTGRVHAIAVQPDTDLAISASNSRTLRIWNVESGQLMRTLRGHRSCVTSVAVTPDGRRAVSGSDDKTLRLWDLENGNSLRTFKGHTESVKAVAIMPGGHRAVSASHDRTLRVWDLDSGESLAKLVSHKDRVEAVAVIPDTQYAISGGWDRTLWIWDLETGRPIRPLEGHTNSIHAVAVTPDGRYAISASDDRTIRVWDWKSDQRVLTKEKHSGDVSALAVTPNGLLAISASSDKKLMIWDLETFQMVHTLEGHTDSATAVAVTPNGRLAISASSDKKLKVWDLQSFQTVCTLEGHTDLVTGVAVTQDGRRAVSASHDRTLQVWDVNSGEKLATLLGHKDRVEAVAVIPDTRCAISGGWDLSLRIWDLETGQTVRTLTGHTAWVTAVAVTHNGHHAISASDDHTLRVWDLATGATLHVLKGHTSRIHAVAVSLDGRWAVSASGDRTLRVWRLDNGKDFATFTGEGGFMSCAVTPNASTIIGGDGAGSVHFLQLVV